MLSQTVEYALRAMVVLAGSAQARTAAQVAQKSKVPVEYLFKVLQALTRAGLVTAHRGKRGGFSLARPPALINLLDVVSAIDPIRRVNECPLGLRAHERELCPLHRKLDDAARLVEDAFRTTCLADLVGSPLPPPLCPGLETIHVPTQ